MGDVIDLDGDVAKNNAGSLQLTAGELPSSQTIGQVDGNRTEPATTSYTTRLESASSQLAIGIDSIRRFVASNAEALNHAVTTLRDTDRMTAEAAGQATALIDDVVAGPSSPAQSRTKNAFQV